MDEIEGPLAARRDVCLLGISLVAKALTLHTWFIIVVPLGRYTSVKVHIVQLVYFAARSKSKNQSGRF